MKLIAYKQNQEVWKNVEGYEGYYLVSNYGRIKSFHRNKKGRVIKPSVMNVGAGYEQVGLYKNGIQKKILLHRLIAETFIANPDNLPFVNHIDENKINNSAENLEWCTSLYNNNHGTRNKRIAKTQSIPVSAKCIRTGNELHFKSISEASRQGFNASSIWKVCNGKMNKHHDYVWKYEKKEAGYI